ncbi:hypothetical protein NUW54_g13265 [Trametes sanguinea]|uniref:Uncharacterized protein n=1 Tax=Trametes sanguinea TaxID=158606 RepID=A0ACC1MPX8_9APHY|nr:hypothetical protein NUW54_g13265 [Trametes sanguinea]
MSALPAVQSFASFGSTSTSRLGFESGKMIGRSVPFAISRTTSSENAPACVEQPISTVGFTRRTTSSRPTSPWSFACAPAHSPSGARTRARPRTRAPPRPLRAPRARARAHERPGAPLRAAGAVRARGGEEQGECGEG